MHFFPCHFLQWPRRAGRVSSPTTCLELCVTGAAAEGSAVDVLDFRLDRPAILVIGSEGAGVHATLPHSSAIPSCAIYVHQSWHDVLSA